MLLCVGALQAASSGRNLEQCHYTGLNSLHLHKSTHRTISPSVIDDTPTIKQFECRIDQ